MLATCSVISDASPSAILTFWYDGFRRMRIAWSDDLGETSAPRGPRVVFSPFFRFSHLSNFELPKKSQANLNLVPTRTFSSSRGREPTSYHVIRSALRAFWFFYEGRGRFKNVLVSPRLNPELRFFLLTLRGRSAPTRCSLCLSEKFRNSCSWRHWSPRRLGLHQSLSPSVRPEISRLRGILSLGP